MIIPFHRTTPVSKGFTLIELMIVVAVIGILAAIAIPQFSAYRIKAYNAAAVSDLRNGITAEEAYYSANFHYFSIDYLANTGGQRSASLGINVSRNVEMHLRNLAATADFTGISWHNDGDRSYRVTGSFGKIR